MQAVSFRTQARTVDHLGREQIADCPTAVSELWKNAWDAYAEEVRLTVFAGPPALAVVFDDGHGMSRDEFEAKWLTIGTSSKIDGDRPVAESDRQGLPPRPKQGRKGIGRLSIAHLGPLVVVISKRADQRFVVAVVDWRVFENPFLRLEDVKVPVAEFDTPDQLFSLLPELFNYHMENVWPTLDDDTERCRRVEEAWERYDDLAPDDRPSEAIYATADRGEVIEDRHLAAWPVWTGEKSAGTAMIVLDVYPELACWVDDEGVGDSDANSDVREILERALMGFLDPYAEREAVPAFQYAFCAEQAGIEREIVSSEIGVDRESVLDMEHAIDGQFDDYGRFTGKVRAFGKEWVPWTFAPKKLMSQSRRGRVGAFSITIGTFEQEDEASSHPPERHAQLKELAKKHSGLYVYRDHLRLQPYGRPNNDFFRIEQRRSKHAGREFWVHRRMFGRVALTRTGNPNLRDKAGREGLIENTALRRFRRLVEDFLKAAARKFFGSDSPDRKPALAEIRKRNEERAKSNSRRHARLNRKEFTQKMREQRPALRTALSRVSELRAKLASAAAAGDVARVETLGDELEAEKTTRASLQLPMRPRDLGSYEPDWREYRDDLAELSAGMERLSSDWRQTMQELKPASPEQAAQSAFGRHQKSLHDLLRRWQRESTRILSEEIGRLEERTAADRRLYYERAAPIVAQAAQEGSEIGLAGVLDGLERVRDELEDEFRGYYPPYIRALSRLADGVDLDSALQWSADEREELERRLADLSAVAQLGIAFEIIGHEFHDIQRHVMSNLKRLPSDVQRSEAFRAAMTAYQSLVRRLKFFTPLLMAGRVVRERITGDELARYLESFFGDYFARERITLIATPTFRKFVITDHRWRIYPVFVNLLQNARYWVRQVDRARVIRLDRRGDRVIVADSGPGIDIDEADAVFDLFYSQRKGGRGVGLYLVRVNLSAGRHDISLVTGPDDHDQILPGANFVIRFEGMEYDDE